jgi:3-oxosteroid 1-dehydrogenase
MTVSDMEADLVVVGSGAAGMAGAVTAAISGGTVVVVEKAHVLGGTSAIAGGGAWLPLNHHELAQGVDDSREDALAYVRACCGDAIDDDVAEALIDNAAPLLRFLEEEAGCSFRPYPLTGPTYDYRPELQGGRRGGRAVTPARTTTDGLGDWRFKLRVGGQSAWVFDKLEYFARSLHAQPPAENAPGRAGLLSDGREEDLANGAALLAQLLKACLAHDVPIELSCPAEQLLVEDGRVVGVRVRRDGATFKLRARGGVLLATGGFSHNDELKRRWLDRPLVGACEILENQGDGHLMGLDVGAQLAAVTDASWTPQGGGPRQLPHAIIVNARGRRFVNEGTSYYDLCEAFGTKTGQAGPKNVPAWIVFDGRCAERYETAARMAARAGLPSPPGEVDLSDDIARVRLPDQQPVFVGETLEALAAQVGIDPAGLTETVDRFNGFARAGRDDDFGRGDSAYDREWGDPRHGPNPSLGTLERAPFYASPVFPGALGTKGGLRVNGSAQVLLARTSEPIPGLYAAGACSSCVYPGAYPGMGATIGAGMTFGYIAARHALGTLLATSDAGAGRGRETQ